MRRVIVIGTTGSGKTALAQRVSERLGVPFFDLDALYWGPDWTPYPDEQFRAAVRQALSADAWAAGGNYSRARDIVWARADTLVWLDYPLPLVLWRLLRRTARRIRTREELWAGNRETFRAQFLSRDSLFLYALRSHPRHRRQYPLALSQPEHAHLAVLRFRDPRETRRWVDGLSRAA
jgi:adenylate kinase family enzyme